MRGLLRLFLRGTGALIAAPILYVLAAFAGAVLPGGGSWSSEQPQVRIGLLRGLIHYDFLLPVDARLHEDFAFALPPDATGWMAIGWGSEAFYTTAGTYSQITASAIWQAATGDAAVLRIEMVPVMPPDWPAVSWLDLSQAQYDALVAAIAQDAHPDGSGPPQRHPAPGFTATDSFWSAPGRFSLLRPCNQWVSERLRAADVPFGLWTPTPESVALSLWWNARPQG